MARAAAKKKCCRPSQVTLLVAGDPQVDLVDQRRRRQGLARRLSRQSRPRQLVQFGINQRQEVGHRLSVPGLGRLEHRGHLRVARVGHHWPGKKE